MTTQADRLNQIIREQGISKTEFARRVGITKNYIMILTADNERARKARLSKSLARLISLEFGYDENWILHGDCGEDYCDR